MTETWTKQCEDGRACAWSGTPAFVPDGQYMCDRCLAAALDLKAAYCSGCNCCEMDEDAVTEASALAAIRDALSGVLYIKRYYVASRPIYYNRRGKEVDDPTKASIAKTETMYLVVDSDVPFFERTPIKEWKGYPGWTEARKFADKLNKQDQGRTT